MPCSCDGYPESPTDLVTRAHEAKDRIKHLEQELDKCRRNERRLAEELATLKEAFKLMGNGVKQGSTR